MTGGALVRGGFFGDLFDKVVEVEGAIFDHLPDLVHFHVGVLREELLDGHEAAADAHDQSPRDQLYVDLPRPEDVVPVAQSLDRHRLSQRVEVLRYQLVDEVPLDRPVPGKGSLVWQGLLRVRGGRQVILLFV